MISMVKKLHVMEKGKFISDFRGIQNCIELHCFFKQTFCVVGRLVLYFTSNIVKSKIVFTEFLLSLNGPQKWGKTFWWGLMENGCFLFLDCFAGENGLNGKTLEASTLHRDVFSPNSKMVYLICTMFSTINQFFLRFIGTCSQDTLKKPLIISIRKTPDLQAQETTSNHTSKLFRITFIFAFINLCNGVISIVEFENKNP